MIIAYKEYNYSLITVYYLTVNGHQFGPVHLTKQEMLKALNNLKE